MRIGRDQALVSGDDVERAYERGRTIAEIADYYGVSAETMRRFMHAANVPVRRSGSSLSSERARELAIRGSMLRRGFR